MNSPRLCQFILSGPPSRHGGPKDQGGYGNSASFNHPLDTVMLPNPLRLAQPNSQSTAPTLAMAGPRPWMAPSVALLPPLALLFLQTGDPIDGNGGTGGGGSSVF